MLDLAFKSMKNISCLTNELLKRTILVVAYIDCDSLWSILMIEIVFIVPKMRFCCREAIVKEIIHSIFLIHSSSNSSDATTEQVPNNALQNATFNNVFYTLQNSYTHVPSILVLTFQVYSDILSSNVSRYLMT